MPRLQTAGTDRHKSSYRKTCASWSSIPWPVLSRKPLAAFFIILQTVVDILKNQVICFIRNGNQLILSITSIPKRFFTIIKWFGREPCKTKITLLSGSRLLTICSASIKILYFTH